MMRSNVLWALSLTLTLFLGACSEDTPGTTGPTGDGSQAESVDETLFAQIKGYADVLATGNIWQGYDYGAVRQYIIYVSGNEPKRGFIINPSGSPSGATKLADSERAGLDVWRYDGAMQKAYDQLNGSGGNGAYDFGFEIDGTKYYVQSYTDDQVAAPYEAVDLSVHETFHGDQNAWTELTNWNQDVANFPMTQELVELQMLVGEIFRDMPNTTTDKAEMRKMLEQYVAIRAREIAIDPSSGKLIENFEIAQEQVEGSAKYLEVMAHRAHFKNTKPIADYGLMELGPTTRTEAKDLIAQTVTYNTGGTALYLLNELGVDIEQMRQGKTPYELAIAFLGMSQSERDAALAAAKGHAKWGEIQTEAKKWMGLQ